MAALVEESGAVLGLAAKGQVASVVGRVVLKVVGGPSVGNR